MDADLRVHPDQEGRRVGPLGGQVAQPAIDLDRHGLLGEHDALALADRAGLGHDLAHPVGHVLARHLDEPERRDLDHVGLRAVLVERLAERLQHGVAVARPGHVDEVDDDDPADVAQPQLADDLLGGLEVGPRDRVLELGSLAATGERPRVHVDDRHRLGVVDHQVAAARQVHPALQHRLDRVLDAVLLEQWLVLVVVVLEPVEQLRRSPREEGLEPVMLLLVVHDRLLELAREDVARHPHRQVGLLEDHLRRLRLLGALLEHVVELVEVLDLALEVLARGALGRGADDHAALAEVDLLRGPAQAVALLVVQPPRHADALALGHVHEVAPGDRELHRQARALGLQRVLDRLHQDLLVRLEELRDPLALAAATPAAAASRDLDAREDHVVRVQEAVLVDSDVHEGGLEAGEDVVDLALVDVPDDRAIALALYVELCNAPVGLRLLLLPLTAGGGTLRFQDRDSCFAPVHRDEQLLLQEEFPS